MVSNKGQLLKLCWVVKIVKIIYNIHTNIKTFHTLQINTAIVVHCLVDWGGLHFLILMILGNNSQN